MRITTAAWLTLSCWLILGARQAPVSIHVTDAAGQPITRATVCATRRCQLAGMDQALPGAKIPVEVQLTCDDAGIATFELPPATTGLDQVLLWAGANGYTPALAGGVPLQAATPTLAETRLAGVLWCNLEQSSAITIALDSPFKRISTEMVTMSDGTRLATDVYVLKGERPMPVLLLRTPYGKDGLGQYATQAAALGFSFVAQDVRGRHESEGDNLPFIADGWGEHRDGYDICTWLTQQNWCDGNIGTMGASALGITQNLTAPTQPPGLRCQYISVATTSLYHQAAYQGGALRVSQVEGWLTDNKYDPLALELYRAHPDYDQFWRQFDISAVVGDITVPAIHEGGWFDTFCQGTLDSYMLRQHRGGDGARGQQKLIMGPWRHSIGKRELGQLTFPENAASAPGNWRERWFSHWLRGDNNGIIEEPAVLYYTMGALGEEGAPGNEWRSAADWPVPCIDTPLYLAADGALAWDAPATGMLDYLSDPANPVPTKGGRNLILEAGIMDQRELEARADVLVFTTAPLAQPLNVTGRIRCKLFVSSDAVDTDVAARLCDVYPDGRSMLIADGILRLGHRNSCTRREPLKPGQMYAVEVDLWSTSLIFNRGHAIRLSLAGSNYPRWDVNPGTGAVWSDGCAYSVQHDTVHCGQDYPSAIILPVVQ
jgi:uncharacterized protein